MNLAHVRRFWLAGVVLVAVLALLPFSFHAERHLETATRIEGSEAGKIPQELASRFRSPFVDRVVLVIQGLPPANSEEGEQALATVEERLQNKPGVSGVVSYLDFRDPIFLGKGGGTFILVGLASTEGSVESLVTHPVTMTHADVDEAERKRVGITDGLVRLSVGLEDAEDLIEALVKALDAL